MENKILLKINRKVDFYSILKASAYLSRDKIVSKLIKAGADVSLKNKHGETALMLSTKTKIIKMLLKSVDDRKKMLQKTINKFFPKDLTNLISDY
jgi:ankyrin repeat protein